MAVGASATTSSLAWLADAGLTPSVYEPLVALEARLWAGDALDPVLLELVRVRIAQLLDSPADLTRRTAAAVDAGLGETQIAELAAWPTSALVDDRAKAVLRWSEQWVVDPGQLTDGDAATLRAVLTDRECAALSTALAVFEALTRTRVALGLA